MVQSSLVTRPTWHMRLTLATVAHSKLNKHICETKDKDDDKSQKSTQVIG
jgi:hypothetical protein